MQFYHRVGTLYIREKFYAEACSIQYLSSRYSVKDGIRLLCCVCVSIKTCLLSKHKFYIGLMLVVNVLNFSTSVIANRIEI